MLAIDHGKTTMKQTELVGTQPILLCQLLIGMVRIPDRIADPADTLARFNGSLN